MRNASGRGREVLYFVRYSYGCGTTATTTATGCTPTTAATTATNLYATTAIPATVSATALRTAIPTAGIYRGAYLDGKLYADVPAADDSDCESALPDCVGMWRQQQEEQGKPVACDALLDAYRSRYRRYHRLGGRYALR